MQALGLIETKGLLAAVEAADTMVKSADVSILEKTYVGGGLVTISVTGDVGAVKAAVESGVAAIRKLDESLLISEHVIPSLHKEVESIIGPKNPNPPETLEHPSSNEDEAIEDAENVEDIVEIDNLEDTTDIEVVEELDNLKDSEDVNEDNIEESKSNVLDVDVDKLHKSKLENLHKEDVDNLVHENGMEKAISLLSNLKVVKLRNLAREYEDFVIKGRAISKAGKKLLISKFKLYYEKN